jgi:hypothetical protein
MRFCHFEPVPTQGGILEKSYRIDKDFSLRRNDKTSSVYDGAQYNYNDLHHRFIEKCYLLL